MVKAAVVLKPGGAPDPEREDISSMCDTPILCVWGDHVGDSELRTRLRRSCQRYWRAQSDQGGIADTIDLPAEGRGNSHHGSVSLRNEIKSYVLDRTFYVDAIVIQHPA